MPKVKLTDRFVAGVKTDTQIDYFDTIETGLALRVGSTRKTFSLLYTRPGTRMRTRINIGEYSDLFGLGKARKEARALKSSIEDGKDPQAERVALEAAQAAEMTVRDLVEDYIKKHVASLRSAKEVTRRLRRNILDEKHGIGKIVLRNLHRRDIVKAVDAVSERGAKTEAARCFEDIRAVVRWAVGRGVVDHDVTAGMKPPKRTGAKDRVLSAEEIKTLFAELPNSSLRPFVQDIIRLVFETGCRVSEIAGLSVAEIDLKAGLIRLPAERVKNATAHAVPITDAAAEILERLVDGKKKGFLFPIGDEGPIRGDVVANEIAKAQKGRYGTKPSLTVAGWTAHDIRRTWATMASELGIAPHVIAASLNHKSVNSGVTFAHYINNDFLPERRLAHNTVSVRLQAIVAGGADVIAIRARA